ncbi:AbiV family abortive infection protein [Pseudoalteromonas umbrosa]|uniref:AbiV family abortive infection protein n=1 Tax=Pseudoalteromonas umbrosa TaxID=3048489 RepID=UPI0024C2FE0C|nr:AbiV family abortive infection protein [Pseudoalteromonas sp. B95]MDK1289769.1 AbiV family abortive infection protein [Pseudoalteromonas sp. B95]
MTNKKTFEEDAGNIILGAFSAIQNAQSFCEEAQILHDHKKYARAYVLSHFAREECGKAMMLARAAIEIDLGVKVNWKKLKKRLRCHKQKIINDNFLSRLVLHGVEASATKKNDSDLLQYEHVFSTVKARNDKKNESLYVNYKDGQFVSPSDSISERQSQRNLELASFRSALLVPLLKPYAEKFSGVDFGKDKHPLEDFLKAALPGFLGETLNLSKKILNEKKP